MRKIILYIASSIDGFIADKDGAVDWLESIPNPEKTDYGYAEFFDSIDTTIMGYSTYAQLIEWDIPFPYKGKDNYVITSRSNPVQSEHVKFLSTDIIDTIKKIKQKPGKDIWLIGGSKINALLLQQGLIDQMRLFHMPIVLNDGIELFHQSINSLQHKFSLEYTNTFFSGVIENHYTLMD